MKKITFVALAFMAFANVAQAANTTITTTITPKPIVVPTLPTPTTAPKPIVVPTLPAPVSPPAPIVVPVPVKTPVILIPVAITPIKK